VTALPITPGGLGVTGLGLVGILATSAGPATGVQVTAAVLLYRAVTYLPSIPLGALAILTWRIAPGLIGTRITHPPGQRRPTLAAVPGNASSTAPADLRSVPEPALLPVIKT
jgi:hypothetical protein